MTADISLSNGQYEIDVNSNGNLIIKDSTDTIILKHEDGGAFSLGADLQLGDLVDGSTGDTVYDGSTETIGNGTQTVDANSVNTDEIDIGKLIGALDANGFDITGVGNLNASTTEIEGKDSDNVYQRLTSLSTDIDRKTREETVSTTAVEIFSAEFPSQSNFVQVAGIEGGGPEFGDLVLYSRFGTVSVIGSTERSGPASRSYSVDGDLLKLAMGSNTYEVAVEGTSVGVDK